MTALSKSQIDKLGERLRDLRAEADLRLLNEFVVHQDPIRIEVESVVRSLCRDDEAISSRLKTKTSILEKLQRQHTRLSEMQDIAGLRIVTTGNMTRQEELADSLMASWSKTKLFDRRNEPQHGYRAVQAETVRYLQDLAEHIGFFEAIDQGMGPKAVGDSFATIEKHLDNLRRELLENP